MAGGVARGGGRPTRRWIDGDGLKRGDGDAHLAGNGERNDCRFKTDGDEVRYHRPLSPAKGQNHQ